MKGDIMKKSIWLLIFLVPLIIVSAYADTNNLMHNADDHEARKARAFVNAKKRGVTNLVYYADMGIWIGMEPDPEPMEKDRFKRKMKFALPYMNGGEASRFRLSTLGQLTKMSDYVAAVRVVSVNAITNEFGDNLSMSVDMDIVLFGKIPDKTITVTARWGIDWETMGLATTRYYEWTYRPPPKPGDRLLLFMTAGFAKDPYSRIVFDRPPGVPPDPPPAEVNFGFRKVGVPVQGSYHLLYWEGGSRYLDTPENTTNYLNAVKGYLHELRGEKRDAESYYSLLAELIQSPIQSIREDARSDLMYLIESCPSLDKQRILSDDRIDEAIKYWIDPAFLKAKEDPQKKK